MDPIINSVLGTNNLLFNDYISKTINLAKSISVKNDIEATLYNNYLRNYYPNEFIDYYDKTTWRYYLHLAGKYHRVDKPMTIISLDNGSTISLTKENLALHQLTHKDLLTFSQSYDNLVNTYPEQELLIKAIITDNIYTDINEIVNLEDYSITSYASSLTESNENSLIYELQARLTNYKNIWLIPYYTNSDEFFLATQYSILYHYLVKSILAIRYKYAKTIEAHSFHIKNYLASHYNLDSYYPYLTQTQIFYLYKNLLYLQNHVGMNYIFQSLIDNLFTSRNISLVTYQYQQTDTHNNDYTLKYQFKQKLLNSKPFLYSQSPYLLEDIAQKEAKVAQYNEKYHTYLDSEIDFKLKNTLYNTLLTKDLESIVMDNTDSVRYKFLVILTDYWAYFLKTNRINIITTIVDKITNQAIELNSRDLFKLYTLCLYYASGRELSSFPDYRITYVFREDLSNKVDTYLNMEYLKFVEDKKLIEKLLANVPTYPTNILSNYQFSQYIDTYYRKEIGYWINEANLSHIDQNAQIEYIRRSLHQNTLYTQEQENIADFLERIKLPGLAKYPVDVLNTLIHDILNVLYDYRLDFLDFAKFIQLAMVEIFQKFESYSTQIIDTYYWQSPILVGNKDTRYKSSLSYNYKEHFAQSSIMTIELTYNVKKSYYDYRQILLEDDSKVIDKIEVNNLLDFDTKVKSHFKEVILMTQAAPIIESNNDWLINPNTEEELLFLMLNPLS